jgi:hypothetical protein
VEAAEPSRETGGGSCGTGKGRTINTWSSRTAERMPKAALNVKPKDLVSELHSASSNIKREFTSGEAVRRRTLTCRGVQSGRVDRGA